MGVLTFHQKWNTPLPRSQSGKFSSTVVPAGQACINQEVRGAQLSGLYWGYPDGNYNLSEDHPSQGVWLLYSHWLEASLNLVQQERESQCGPAIWRDSGARSKQCVVFTLIFTQHLKRELGNTLAEKGSLQHSMEEGRERGEQAEITCHLCNLSSGECNSFI